MNHEIVVEELALCAGVLITYIALAVDHNEIRHVGLFGRTHLKIVACLHGIGDSDRERRLENHVERGYIGARIDRGFNDLKSFGAKFRLNATQDLSGFLAMRSRGKDERQTDDLPVVRADVHSSPIGKRDRNIGGLAR